MMHDRVVGVGDSITMVDDNTNLRRNCWQGDQDGKTIDSWWDNESVIFWGNAGLILIPKHWTEPEQSKALFVHLCRKYMNVESYGRNQYVLKLDASQSMTVHLTAKSQLKWLPLRLNYPLNCLIQQNPWDNRQELKFWTTSLWDLGNIHSNESIGTSIFRISVQSDSL